MKHIQEMTRGHRAPGVAQSLDNKFNFLFDIVALLTDSANLAAAIQAIIPGKLPDDSEEG